VENKIFIGGLNYQTSERALFHELQKHGKVISIRIVTEKETGRSRGFGFATFATPEEAEGAIKNMNNTIFDGRRIGVKPSIDKK